MSNELPLKFLPAAIAAARARGQPARLVLRNTDRTHPGAIHLYFHQGRLIQVIAIGQRTTGEENLRDLITWQQGTIRLDDPVVLPRDAITPNPQLETALAETIRQMELRGLLTQDAPPPSDPYPTGHPSQPNPSRYAAPVPAPAPSFSTNPHLPSPPHGQAPHTPPPGNLGLPPLPGPGALPPAPIPFGHAVSDMATTRTPSVTGKQSGPPATNTHGHITDAQWQALARFLHQIVERAAQRIPPATAIGTLMQAMRKQATGSLILQRLDVGTDGWLNPQGTDTFTKFRTFEIAEAIADLIIAYQDKCSLFFTPQEFRAIVIAAATPAALRETLVALGLDRALAALGLDITTE